MTASHNGSKMENTCASQIFNLFERHNYRDMESHRKRTLMQRFVPQMLMMPRPGPGLRQEPGALQPRVGVSSSEAFPGTSIGSWN